MIKPPSEWTVLSMLKWATSYFEQKDVRNPRFSIEWLLAHILDVKRLDLYLMYDRPLEKEELDQLNPLVKRRSLHEPLQYITGSTDFLNTTIKVAPGVLIPRMETEQLVETILNNHHASSECEVLDIGTGSGCIPIAIKKSQADWSVIATDISDDALRIAKENNALNKTEVIFYKDDLFNSTAFEPSQQFDIIISNPPYILEEEKTSLDKEVTGFEPALALFCTSTAAMYGAIKILAEERLRINGSLYLELHEHHAQEVGLLFKDPNWNVQVQKDYDGKERFLVAKKVK